MTLAMHMTSGFNSAFEFPTKGMSARMGYPTPHKIPFGFSAQSDDFDHGDEANGDALINHVSSFVLDEVDTPPPSASDLSDGVPSSPPASGLSPNTNTFTAPVQIDPTHSANTAAMANVNLAMMQAAQALRQQQQLFAAAGMGVLPAHMMVGVPSGMGFPPNPLVNPMIAMYANQAQLQLAQVQLAQMQAQLQAQAMNALLNTSLSNNANIINNMTTNEAARGEENSAIGVGGVWGGGHKNGMMNPITTAHHQHHNHTHHKAPSLEGTESHDGSSTDVHSDESSDKGLDGHQGLCTSLVDGDGRANEICLAYLTSKCRFPRCRRVHVDVKIPEGICPCWYITGFCKFHRKCRLEHTGRPLLMCAPAQTKRMTQKDRKKAERVREHCGPTAKKVRSDC